MAPDPALSASLKLEGEWSALHYASELTAGTITDLVDRLERLEPMTRVRLLLSALLLPRAKREEFREELQVGGISPGASRLCFCAVYSLFSSSACHWPQSCADLGMYFALPAPLLRT